jgi:hypothetical protein
MKGNIFLEIKYRKRLEMTREEERHNLYNYDIIFNL